MTEVERLLQENESLRARVSSLEGFHEHMKTNEQLVIRLFLTGGLALISAKKMQEILDYLETDKSNVLDKPISSDALFLLRTLSNEFDDLLETSSRQMSNHSCNDFLVKSDKASILTNALISYRYMQKGCDNYKDKCDDVYYTDWIIIDLLRDILKEL